jgi:gliding motility-associated-like protein
VTDASGCTQSTTVVVGTSGSATANAGIDVTITQGQTTGLTGSGGGTYSWTPNNSLDCATCQNPNATPTVTTTYILTVTDSLGCTDTDTITVFVDIICGELFLPNAFSPNGDGQNDVYYVRGNCIATLQFEIYNRWGELVFSTTDHTIGWDGTWREKECETAVFTYFLKATMLDGTEVEKQGNISLVK